MERSGVGRWLYRLDGGCGRFGRGGGSSYLVGRD